MKDKRYANRGQTFEEFIRYANARYAQKGIALIEKLPTEFIPLRDGSGKIRSVKVEHKSKVDFIGRYKRYPIAIEAKNTNTDSIRFDAIQPHQAEYMDSFGSQAGTISLVLVSFGLRRVFAIPWRFWSAAYDVRVRRGDRKSPVTVSAYGTTWDIPRKASVRVDELDPSWEVPANDTTFGLHYLKDAEKHLAVPNYTPK